MRIVPDMRCSVRVPELGRIRCRLRRHVWLCDQSFLYLEHAYTLGMFDQMIRPGDVIYDIGANIGLYVRAFHEFYGAGRTIAFEPMKDNFQLLTDNIRLGNLQDKVSPFRIALSHENGEEPLQIDDVRSGTAVLNSISGGQPSEGRKVAGLPPVTEVVPVRMLDTFVAEHNLPAPNVIKIDTEGAEIKVLEGGRQTLETHRPRLTIALHGEDKAAGTLQVLDDLGYIAYGRVHSGDGVVHRRLTLQDAANLADNNIMASTVESDVSDPVRLWTRERYKERQAELKGRSSR